MSDSSSDLDRTLTEPFEEVQEGEDAGATPQKNLSGGKSKRPHSNHTPARLNAAKKIRKEPYDSDLDVSVGNFIFHFVRCEFNGHGSNIPSKDPAYEGPSDAVHLTFYVPHYVYDEAEKGNIQALRESLENNSAAWIGAFQQHSDPLLLMRWNMPGITQYVLFDCRL